MSIFFSEESECANATISPVPNKLYCHQTQWGLTICTGNRVHNHNDSKLSLENITVAVVWNKPPLDHNQEREAFKKWTRNEEPLFSLVNLYFYRFTTASCLSDVIQKHIVAKCRTVLRNVFTTNCIIFPRIGPSQFCHVSWSSVWRKW